MMKAVRSTKVIIGLILTILMIVATGIGIWNFLISPYQVEAHLISIRAPMSPRLEQTLRSLSEFSLEDIRQRSKRDALFPTVSDKTLEAAIPAFSWIVKDRLSSVVSERPFRHDHLTVFTIRNSGAKTVRNVQLRTRLAIDDFAVVDRGQRTGEVVKFDGILELGDMAPGLEVNVFVYALLPFFPFQTTVTHDEGVVPIWEYRPVPPPVSRIGGVFIPYRVLTVVLGVIAACLLIAVIFLILKRQRTIS